MKFKAAMLATGMFFLSTSTLASETDMQVAALNNGLVAVNDQSNEEVDDEIGSTDVSGFDNRIGAFSQEDGAMLGAYGDGEYAD